MTRGIDKSKVHDLFQQGHSITQISQMLSVSPQAISYHTCHLKMRARIESQDRLFQESLLNAVERRILVMMANGYSSKEMAQEMHYRRETIDRYRLNMIRKLGLRSSCQLIAWGFKNKYLI